METRNVWGVRITLRLALGLCLVAACRQLPLGAAQSAAKPVEEKLPAKTPSEDEGKALQEAFQSAENNPQALIKNLEDFLTRFPKTSRRELVLRTICREAMEANAPGVTVKYGEMLLEMSPDDPGLLSMLIEALERQNDATSRARAIDYATRLIVVGEKLSDQTPTPKSSEKGGQEKWPRRLAAVYTHRATLYEDSGELDKALADYEQSYQAYPSSRTAEHLGDVASKKSDSARGVDYYLTAFAFPEKDPDPSHRQEIRRKLGSAYVALHRSEKGMGDMVLLRYDQLMQQLAGRFSNEHPQNAGRHDPFEFVLERTDGTPLRLADYRGKVMVMDFWATWCGPCRLEGKLFERVRENFRMESGAAFLAVNVDEDRSSVPAFLKEEGWSVPVAYALGLDQLLGVVGLPTVVIFDRAGRVVYRQEGLDPESFVEELDKRLREALHQPAAATGATSPPA
ncbi:MAG: TlpA family protein disulfide reductase [Acidobacteriia bacterium]|nr:TlpA family protein disulfide reductase [Terriglobia bacterium]